MLSVDKMYTAVLATIILLCLAASLEKVKATKIFNVTDYASVLKDDNQAFEAAWEDACLRGGNLGNKVIIPAGKTLLLNPITLNGPCKSNINVEVLGKIVAPGHGSKYWGNTVEYWIKFMHVHGLTITGTGLFDGQGATWWPCSKNKQKCPTVPHTLGIMGCSVVTIRGLKFLNSPEMHIAIVDSNTVHISELTIMAPGDSPNTDGIHIERSRQVQVLHSTIGTGDDCISIGAGSSNINISQITCGPGHGISIGSLGKGGSMSVVSDVEVSHCTFIKTMNGARIKTWQGGSGSVKRIHFDNMNLQAVDNPIIIDQYYCDSSKPCPNMTSAVQVSEVSFTSARGTATREIAIRLACSQSVACTGIVIDNVIIDPVTPGKKIASYCVNARGLAKAPVAPTIPCLRSA